MRLEKWNVYFRIYLYESQRRRRKMEAGENVMRANLWFKHKCKVIFPDGFRGERKSKMASWCPSLCGWGHFQGVKCGTVSRTFSSPPWIIAVRNFAKCKKTGSQIKIMSWRKAESFLIAPSANCCLHVKLPISILFFAAHFYFGRLGVNDFCSFLCLNRDCY